MRKDLKAVGSEDRHRFTATFVRLGYRSGYKCDVQTVLLSDVKLNDKVVTDHLWFDLTKGFKEAGLTPGDTIEFSARVRMYEKGYKGYRWDVCCPVEKDYKLSYPTKIKKIEKEVENE